MPSKWIRGVNLGGWLVLERWITPYLFALNTCQLQGDFCYYPNQTDAPQNGPICDLYHCKPHTIDRIVGGELIQDYPFDEYTLMESFDNKVFAEQYLRNHYKNFVTRQDIQFLKEAGVSHIRVPIPHWIFGDIQDGEPWVEADGWLYFVRLVGWCREEGIHVWPDLHTVPGSQNGFDNSGHLLQRPTCINWSNNSENIERTLQVVKSITEHIKEDGLEDMVTGIGVLNEPYLDCDLDVVKQYNEAARKSIRKVLGDEIMVYTGDMFNSTIWNDGWWNDKANTILDSHYFHMFPNQRALSPKQHVAYVCRNNHHDTVGCCYDDPPKNTKRSPGISRMVGEWSASFDTPLWPTVDMIMKSISQNYTAAHMDRKIPKARQEFLKNFVQAQMVAYEAESAGVSVGWFFWTLKTEGGAFAEWDFMRGIREGWIPKIPEPTKSSESIYGSCEDILSQTEDDMSIIRTFSNQGELYNWQGTDVNDDLVLSIGDGEARGETVDAAVKEETKQNIKKDNTAAKSAKKDEDSSKPKDSAETQSVETIKTTKSSASKAPNDKAAAQSNQQDAIEKHANSKSKASPSQNGSSFNVLPLLVLGFFVFAIRRVFFSDNRPASMRVPDFPSPTTISFQSAPPGMSRYDRSQYQSVASHEGLDV